MPPENKKKADGKPNRNARIEYGRSPRIWIWLLLLALLFLGPRLWSPIPEPRNLNQIEFRSLIESNLVAKVEMVRDSDGMTFLSGELKPQPNLKKNDLAFSVNVLPSENLENFLIEHKVPCPLVYRNDWFGKMLPEMLWFGVGMVIIGFLFFRFFRSANSSAMNFGKSRAKMMSQDCRNVRFSDVGGVAEAKEEVQEIVEFLKAPAKFRKLGGRIPKGVLMMGPPGTGKTLLAKAIAGESGVPFFSISGSDFIEMFVGVGASRVRDMFEQGKKNAPCIIFIDEIDAIGRSRFSGIGGGHDEREQTLNAMLVEMDGFDTNDGVIVIAATNRADVLDPALLRPGRFDRQIVVDLPTREGRLEILKMHASKIKLAEDSDLDRVARGTPGFSGADLANLLNEAALIAARNNEEGVRHRDLEEARDKVLWGRERRSHALGEDERAITAWHEAGHALLQVLLPHAEPLHKVTIIPRGRALGATMSLPEKDVLNRTRNQLTDMIAVATGGRIAEKFHTGDISTGARQDIKMASDIARKMVCAYGMSDRFGFHSFGDNQETLFLGKEYTRSQSYSEATAQLIDEECQRIVSEQYIRAEMLLSENREKLELLVNCLLERETVDGRDIEELVKTGKISRLEPPPLPEENPPADEETGSNADPQNAEEDK